MHKLSKNFKKKKKKSKWGGWEGAERYRDNEWQDPDQQTTNNNFSQQFPPTTMGI